MAASMLFNVEQVPMRYWTCHHDHAIARAYEHDSEDIGYNSFCLTNQVFPSMYFDFVPQCFFFGVVLLSRISTIDDNNGLPIQVNKN